MEPPNGARFLCKGKLFVAIHFIYIHIFIYVCIYIYFLNFFKILNFFLFFIFF